MSIKLGVALHGAGMDYRKIVALSEECEALGYDYLWASNEKFFRDMYVVATVMAERTGRVSIGTFVADPYTQHPALTAAAVATLDEVSGGRAILGIGAGGSGLPVMGINRVKPAKAIREAIVVIRKLWRGETVDFEGEVVQCHNGRLSFPSRADIPIVVATRGDLVLRTAGEVADRVMIATYAEPEGVRHALSMVSEGAARAGRDPGEPAIISRVDACISDDRRAAIDAVKPFVGVFLWASYPDRAFVRHVGLEVPGELEEIIARRDYNLMASSAHLVPDEFVDKFCWAGTAEEVAQKVAEVVKTGIRDITILPHSPRGGDVLETMREFATTVKPMVERSVSS